MLAVHSTRRRDEINNSHSTGYSRFPSPLDRKFASPKIHFDFHAQIACMFLYPGEFGMATCQSVGSLRVKA